MTTARIRQSDGTVRVIQVPGGRVNGLRQEIMDAVSGTELVPGARVTLDGTTVVDIQGPDSVPVIVPASPGAHP